MGRKLSKKPVKKQKKDQDDNINLDKMGRVRKKSQLNTGTELGTWTEEEMNTALTQ